MLSRERDVDHQFKYSSEVIILAYADMLALALMDPDKAPMSLPEIVGEEIKEFKSSAVYKYMVEAEQYFRNRSAVQQKTNDVSNRSNTKIEHPILKKLIEQKVNYLLANPFSVSTESGPYADALNVIFDDTFRRKLKGFGRSAIKSGIGWLQPYFDDKGNLAVMKIPSTEIIPLWKDTEHTSLDGFIRFYDFIEYTGKEKKTITRAEWWSTDGVRYYRSAGGAKFEVDKEMGQEGQDFHFYINNKPYNWEKPPIIWVKYNDEELPLCYFIKELIDDINWQTSVTSDVLRDVAKFIYVLRNFGGQDLAEFIKDLREHLAIKVDGDGGVDKLTADINIDAVIKFLEKQRRDVFDFGSAVDTKDPELGNASGTAINFRYMDLNADCSSLALELKDSFQQLKVFLDAYMQLKGLGDFTAETFDIVFNTDMPVNETDVINNAKASQGLVSKQTILENHPWVTDVEEETKRQDDEAQKAMELFGDGLFDDPLDANNQNDQNKKAKAGDQ